MGENPNSQKKEKTKPAVSAVVLSASERALVSTDAKNAYKQTFQSKLEWRFHQFEAFSAFFKNLDQLAFELACASGSLFSPFRLSKAERTRQPLIERPPCFHERVDHVFPPLL